MIDFDELERRCREAESGEWRTHGPSKPQPDAPEGGDFAIICGSDIIAETFYRSGYETTHNARANAEFIAALRNAAPELIAMARRYQWLRNEAWYTSRAAPAVCMVDGAGRPFLCRETRYVEPILEGSSLDEAIDAAMQEKP